MNKLSNTKHDNISTAEGTFTFHTLMYGSRVDSLEEKTVGTGRQGESRVFK